jgi:predicted branched-subunit amino acid permease
MALKPDDPDDGRLAFFATGISIFILCNISTCVGAVGGEAIGDTSTYGLDAAVPAAFLALVWPRRSFP